MKNETKWSVDLAHSEIGFKVRHLMIAHVKDKASRLLDGGKVKIEKGNQNN